MPGVRGGAAGGARGAGVQPGAHCVRRVLDPGPRLLPRLVPRAREGGARQVQFSNCEIYHPVNRLRSFLSLGHLVTRSLGFQRCE